MLDRQANYCLS